MSLIRPCRLQYIMHTLVFYTTYDDIRDQHSFPTRRSSDLFLRKVDETIEDVIRYNFESDPDDKIFEKLLFKKATALFHQGHVEKSEYITRELLKINLRSEEHTSELQSRGHLVCRLLLENINHS